MRRLDDTLAVDPDRGAVVCRRCDEAICEAGANYERHAPCDRRPLEAAGPLVNDPADYVDDDLEFRQYYCPGCATLPENEVIEASLPPVYDKQRAGND
jgi:N-methylhydantoinase B